MARLSAVLTSFAVIPSWRTRVPAPHNRNPVGSILPLWRITSYSGENAEIIPLWTHTLQITDHNVVAENNSLSREHSLTAYDAAYPALALDRKLPLATLDEDLIRAGKGASVKLLSG